MVFIFLLPYIALANFSIPLKRRQEGNAPSDLLQQNFEYNLLNYGNLQYTGNLSIGNPQQEFTFIFDTQSTTSWLPSTEWSAKSCHFFSGWFDKKVSDTLECSKERSLLDYGDGSVEGEIWSETMTINGMTIHNQTLILTYNEHDFKTLYADGLIGLGLASPQNGQITFLENLKQHGHIDSAMFSVYLSGHDFLYPDPINTESTIIFGGHDCEKYASGKNFTYVPLNAHSHHGHWSIDLTRVKVRKHSVTHKGDTFNAIIDIGNSFIVGPRLYMQTIYRSFSTRHSCVFSEGGYLTCTCAYGDLENSSFPQLTFEIESQHLFTLDPKDYIVKSGDRWYVLLVSNNTATHWTLGDVFLRKYYSVFDLEHHRVGFVGATEVTPGLSAFWVIFIIVSSIMGAAFWIICVVLIVRKFNERYVEQRLDSGRFNELSQRMVASDEEEEESDDSEESNDNE